MKILVLIFIFLSTITVSFGRETNCPFDKKELVKMTIEKSLSDEDIQQNWVCVFKEQNLRKDSNLTNNNFKDLFPISDDKEFKIKGSIRYYGIFPKTYNYNVKLDSRRNKIIIGLNLHLYISNGLSKSIEICNSNNSDLLKKYSQRKIDRKRKNCQSEDGNYKYYPEANQLFNEVDSKIKLAEDIWNKSAPEGVEFSFKRVNSKENANYSIKLVNFVSAMYSSFLYYNFREDVYAHEIGHMMGLDEEYAVITSNIFPYHQLKNDLLGLDETFETTATKDMRCNINSIMCLKDKVYSYHYENILRRIPQN